MRAGIRPACLREGCPHSLAARAIGVHLRADQAGGVDALAYDEEVIFDSEQARGSYPE